MTYMEYQPIVAYPPGTQYQPGTGPIAPMPGYRPPQFSNPSQRRARGWLWFWITGGLVGILAVVFLAVGLTTTVSTQGGTHSASYNQGYHDVMITQQENPQFLQHDVANRTVMGTCNELETMSSLASGNPANMNEYVAGCQDGMARLGYRDRGWST
jgi:hypothetical protein